MFKWLNPFKRTEQRSNSLENPNTSLGTLWYGTPTLSGIPVNEKTAYSYAAFWCGVQNISSDTASLKFPPYKKTPKGKVEATDHWSFPLIAHSPDGTRSSLKFWTTLVQHAIASGNGYAEIEFKKSGEGSAFQLLNPKDVKPKIIDKQLWYDVDGRLLPAWKIIHIASAISCDGIVGRGVISAARESIGLGLSGEISMAAFYGNSSKPFGFYKLPNSMSANAKSNFRLMMENMHQGPINNGRVGFLEEGTEFDPITLPPPDEAYLKSREFQIQEMARWLNCPPTKLGDYSRATFSNLEQADLDYVSNTIKPWSDIICAELQLKVFDEEERFTHFIRPDFHELIKADSTSRAAIYSNGRQWGWLSANDIRDLENMNSLGASGDIYLSPVNMVIDKQILQEVKEPKQEEEQEETKSTDTKAIDAVRNVVIDAALRIARRDKKAILKAASKPDFLTFTRHYFIGQEDLFIQSLAPSVIAFSQVANRSIDIKSLATAWNNSCQQDLIAIEQITIREQLPKAMEELLENWEERMKNCIKKELDTL